MNTTFCDINHHLALAIAILLQSRRKQLLMGKSFAWIKPQENFSLTRSITAHEANEDVNKFVERTEQLLHITFIPKVKQRL